MGDIKQEKLERFVRESAWEDANVEEHLQQTVPEALIFDGMGIPKQATTALLLVINGVVRPEKWTTAR